MRAYADLISEQMAELMTPDLYVFGNSPADKVKFLCHGVLEISVPNTARCEYNLGAIMLSASTSILTESPPLRPHYL